MDSVTDVLVFLLAVVVSGVLARMLPVAVPRPLVQIALGAAIGLVSHLRVALDPEVFFLVFLPPLLFLDGWRIPNEALFRDRATILGLALGLVVLTVVGVGTFVHWMLPAMPLAVAFALAAVVSPTDPVAVSAIAARVPVPARIMHILEGEALLNDASGLVCLQFAVAAALTGTFSLPSAALTFLWVALGGVAVGAGLTWVVTRAQGWIVERLGEEGGSEILTSLLIPFAAYLAAEALHSSGVLAAVTAGVTISMAATSGRGLATTRVSRRAVWDVVQFAANGTMFVLLGEQLPAILAAATTTAHLTGHRTAWWLAGYVLAIGAALAALRFLWVWVWLRLTLLRAERRGAERVRPNPRLTAAVSVAGVRGAITLAGVLTLPLVMRDGTPFPARALAITLAAGVILLSLVVASIGLPLLLTGLEVPAEPAREAEEDHVRAAATRAAITALERTVASGAAREGVSRTADGVDDDLFDEAASQVLDLYRARLERHSQDGSDGERARRVLAVERELRHLAIGAERDEVFRLLRARQVGSEIGRKLVLELDLLDARYHA